ncbi:elongation factor P, partial [bacterium]|nr:elongation factor P [bacterium]
MNISANDLRRGDAVLMNGQLFVCYKAERRVMGRKSAFVQVILKNIQDGTQKDMKFGSSDIVDRVDLFEKAVQFLYQDGDTYVFMDNSNYEQFELGKDVVSDAAPFLKDGLEIRILFYEQTAISLKLPTSMDFEITEADPNIKGATASAQYKNATIDNGLEIKVP